MARFGFDPRFSAIAITGGPCAGKSTLMAAARQYLEGYGMRVAIQSEVATELIMAGFSPVEGWQESMTFQEHLLLYMLDREERYYRMLTDQATEKPLILLCDRGVLDAIAYVGRSNFLNLLDRLGFDLHDLTARYRAVVHMVTAADGAEDFYTLTNNAARSESPQTARDLDRKTREAWSGHQHLFVIDNHTNFDQKVRRALQSLARVLTMPVPQEKERKFVLENWHPDMLPADAVSVEITQTYLTFGENGKERRVRKRVLDGSSSYYYTRKLDTTEVGVRDEEEDLIPRGRYEELLKEQDPRTVPILKTRHTFLVHGHRCEVDEYHEPIADLVVVEREVEDMKEEIIFPPGWKVREVTGDPWYKNRTIAERPSS